MSKVDDMAISRRALFTLASREINTCKLSREVSTKICRTVKKSKALGISANKALSDEEMLRLLVRDVSDIRRQELTDFFIRELSNGWKLEVIEYKYSEAIVQVGHGVGVPIIDLKSDTAGKMLIRLTSKKSQYDLDIEVTGVDMNIETFNEFSRVQVVTTRGVLDDISIILCYIEAIEMARYNRKTDLMFNKLIERYVYFNEKPSIQCDIDGKILYNLGDTPLVKEYSCYLARIKESELGNVNKV